MWRKNKVLILAGLMALLQACSSTGGIEGDDSDSWTAEKLFQEAKSALDGGAYDQAIDYFQKLESRFPFGRYAQQAQLETAYAWYKRDMPEQAISQANLFIKLHPRHPQVDYAYYLRGLAAFKIEEKAMDKFAGKDPADIDPGGARQAFGYFSELVKNFPDSRYAEDSRQRMIYLRNLLASHELKVARYYFRKNAFVAAVNRAKYIIENYQGTDAIPGAVRLMAESYKLMDMTELARDTQRVLEMNPPAK